MNTGKMIWDRDFTIGTVSRRIAGSFVEHLGHCLYGGVYQPSNPEADAAGFRNDVKALIRELGVTVIRYPGGNFVSGYNWKDGIGDRRRRPARRELAWGVTETNEVGIDEFSAYLRELGVELMLSANLGTGTPKEAGELIEYCNVRGGTAWSDLRRQNGCEQPYGVGLLCLGNEMDGDWQICAHTPQEYARLCREAAKIVKWTDPAVETVACGSCTDEIGHRTFGTWDRAVLEEAYDVVDYLSLHRYYNYNPGKQLAYPMHDNPTDIPYFFTDLEQFLETIIGVCDAVKGVRRSERTVHLSFDEWGVITETGAMPGLPEQEFGYANFSQMDAVIYGGLLCVFLNHADRVKIACQSLLVNEGGMITADPSGRAIRQATFYPFRDVARYAPGAVALRGVAALPKQATDHHGEQPSVRTACVYDPEKKEITVFIANLDRENGVTLSLDLRSFGPLEALEGSELYTADCWARNTFEAEYRVAPVGRLSPAPTGGRASAVLKPHSWNVLRYRET